jgi:hypothetical protein
MEKIMNEQDKQPQNTGEETEVSLDRVHLGDDYYIDGHIVGNTIKAHDIVENGQSAMQMTGQPLNLKPISFDYLKKEGFTPRIEKVRVKSHVAHSNSRSYYVQEHTRSKPSK